MKYRGFIDRMTVSSDFPHVVYGNARGLVSEHWSASAARRSCEEDVIYHNAQGGCSDAHAYTWSREMWKRIDWNT